MAVVSAHDSRQYSWLWVSHISPKNSKWLQENLSDMDTKVKAMIKLINEDADSFARRAEMYYKKRPELMKQVEEFYRAYRALAERYDQATGALRQAHRTISEVFPNQMPSMDESPSSAGQEVEPHTPEMPTFSRPTYESDDHNSKRNSSHSQETSALSNRKSLKQSNDLSLGGENAPRAVFDGKARKGLNFESPEVKGKEDSSNGILNMQEEISRLLAENQNLKLQMLLESERAKKAETEIQNQKDTSSQLNSVKDTSILQYDQSIERLSALESELSKAQGDLKKLTDEMALEVQKLNSAESHNSMIQSELEALDQKVKLQQQELDQKLKELENLHSSFQEEHEKRMHAESALLSKGKEGAQSKEEVQRLTIEIKMANEHIDELMQSKMHLESAVCEMKMEVGSLTEQNHSSELLIQQLRGEINSLTDSRSELRNEIQSIRGTMSQLSAEKDGALLQHQQSVERVSVLESQLMNTQSELEVNENKVHILMKDVERKREEIHSIHGQLQNESDRRTQTEAALLMSESLHSKLEEEVRRLTQDLDTTIKKLSELENEKLNLENTSTELKKTILGLNSEMDASLLQQHQSLEKVSDLESQLSETKLKLEKSEQKMQLLELEIGQMSESVNSLELALKDEAGKRVQAETSLRSMENMYSQSQEEVSRLHREIEMLNGKSNELENLSSELKSTILLLNTEKDATLLKNQESSMRVSDLESELSQLQAELQTSLDGESKKRIECEAALLLVTDLHSKSQDEVNKLAMHIEELTGKLSEVENIKMDLENIVNKHTKDIHILREQNLSAELIIKDLHCELGALKELNVRLEAEVGSHIGEKEAIRRDFVRQREEKENLDGIHHALAYEMNALKDSAAANQLLIEELQITNLKLKEVYAKNLIEKALLSEKLQEMEKLSEEYSVLENSVSDANAEIEGLREKIEVLESSESSLNDEISTCVFEKDALLSELDTLGKSFAVISEKNSALEMSLCGLKAEFEDMRIKLKDSEKTCQAQLADNSALSAEKNNLFSQLQNITVVAKALESKRSDLQDKHTSLSREKDLVYDQVRKLKGLLRTINKECENAVKSHEMHANSLEKQISSLHEKIHDMDERLQEEEQKSMGASISVVALESSLVYAKDENVALLNKCQKYAFENHAAKILISQLEDKARYHESERKTLLKLSGRLREGISHHMKVLNIDRDLGPAEIAQDEILLQYVSDETSSILKHKEEIEDDNTLMYTELSVLSTVMLQLGTEFRDLHLQKCALEEDVEREATELISLQIKNCQLLESNDQLRQELQNNSERDQLQKIEALVLHEKLSCLAESHEASQDKITDMAEKNESLSKEHQSLIEKYNALEDENGTALRECMMLEHLSLFLRGHNNEVASALVSLTDEMALLSLVKGELDNEVKVLSARVILFESENNYLKKYLVYLTEVLMTRLILLEFDLNTGKSISQELAVELESCMAQLMQKDDELLEAEENVQLMQAKNRELCGVVGVLQVAIEGAKVVKGELEKKIVILTEEGTTKDGEILLLRQENETLEMDAGILKRKEQSLISAHELMSEEVEEHERESLLLIGDTVASSVSVAAYKEMALQFMMEAKAIEISAIVQKEIILNKISMRDAHIEALQKNVIEMQEENAELNAELSMQLALIGSLSNHISLLEEDALSLSKPYSTECKEETCMQEDKIGPKSHRFASGTLELKQLMSRIEALGVVISNSKCRRDEESTNSTAKMMAVNMEIQELKTKGGSEIYSEKEKQKDGEGSKGKQVQMMKDIELDEISTYYPAYGTEASSYPVGVGNGANAEVDDEMLQLWEAAERTCKKQTAKSSSCEHEHEHDIEAVEEVKSEYPSSELLRGRDLGIINKLEMLSSAEPDELWGKNVVERLASDGQRLASIQESIEELKRKMGGPAKGHSEYESVSTQLRETEGLVLEQMNLNSKLAKKAENYPALSDSMKAEREGGFPSKRKMLEQVRKGSDNVARLELELQKIQYVLLKLEEEHEYTRLKVSDKRTRVLLKDYLYGRKDHRGKKKRSPFCGCVRSKSRSEP
ncbi:protein NETWORKED 1D-like isoform X1 [Triticum urartu]|uniref:NAB domain-containing protein n=1 Tax=Triticum urartu TaxID=4572 RepID=A0A8R7JY94_TRIUA|nr:protein NETWORKED 1D-like isoform X1 [Triticum urartu]XP_048573334.1 protein NETWORKED 1D-like isoform X1 [Triticum urartu]